MGGFPYGKRKVFQSQSIQKSGGISCAGHSCGFFLRWDSCQKSTAREGSVGSLRRRSCGGAGTWGLVWHPGSGGQLWRQDIRGGHSGGRGCGRHDQSRGKESPESRHRGVFPDPHGGGAAGRHPDPFPGEYESECGYLRCRPGGLSLWEQGRCSPVPGNQSGSLPELSGKGAAYTAGGICRQT